MCSSVYVYLLDGHVDGVVVVDDIFIFAFCCVCVCGDWKYILALNRWRQEPKNVIIIIIARARILLSFFPFFFPGKFRRCECKCIILYTRDCCSQLLPLYSSISI